MSLRRDPVGLLTVADLSARLGVAPWTVRRTLDAARLGRRLRGYRIVTSREVPAVRAALAARGYATPDDGRPTSGAVVSRSNKKSQAPAATPGPGDVCSTVVGATGRADDRRSDAENIDRGHLTS